jgi:hypothetical protein
MESVLSLIPHATIHPDRICLYREVKWDPARNEKCSCVCDQEEVSEINQSFLKSTRKNNGYLSDHATRKLFKSITYLLTISDRKKVFSKVQQKYISFRIVFVTLTLPGVQRHSDKVITNKCFNQLLIELSKYHNCKAYVWRAEKQENGNIHYHLLINQFVEYQELRKRWNRICNKLGYVDEYQARMKEFFKDGFRLSKNKNDKRTVEQQRKAYIIGQKSNWTSPNSTDIHDVRKIRDIKNYVGKYMSKQPDLSYENSEEEIDRLTVKGRLWSCSHNLSNCKGCQLVEDWEVSDEIEAVVKNSGCKVYNDNYFSVVFIDYENLSKFGATKLFEYFASYLIEHFNYHVHLKAV